MWFGNKGRNGEGLEALLGKKKQQHFKVWVINLDFLTCTRGDQEGGRESRAKRSLFPLDPILLGCQPLKSKHHLKIQESALVAVRGATFHIQLAKSQKLETVKSGTTNMPPLIQFNSSSKLDSKSIR